MEKTVQILINSVREEIREFLGEINGPKEEKARDKMITELLGAVNDAELDLGLYRPAKTGRIKQTVVPYSSDKMSSAEVTAEAAANYGQLHN
jgi:hypothetical protein